MAGLKSTHFELIRKREDISFRHVVR